MEMEGNWLVSLAAAPHPPSLPLSPSTRNLSLVLGTIFPSPILIRPQHHHFFVGGIVDAVPRDKDRDLILPPALFPVPSLSRRYPYSS